MTEQSAINFQDLTVGFEFIPKSYTLDQKMVADYLEATADSTGVMKNEPLVPPMAVTAFAMAALNNSLTVPSGTIHVSQELDFLNLVKIGDTITCRSVVSRKQDRAGMHIMNIDMTVTNQNQETVLTGKVGFILPELKSEEKNS